MAQSSGTSRKRRSAPSTKRRSSQPSGKKDLDLPEDWEDLSPDKAVDSFEDMGLSEDLLDALDDMGFEKPTEIQALAIPQALEGRDLVGRAETGSGKTVAFGAPLVDRIEEGRVAVLALVLCPTRELAAQVAEVLTELCAYKPLRVALVVGGEPMGAQIKQLQKGCQIVVGTPGRILDLVKEKWLQLGWVEFAVLDEADEMLEIGFIDEVTAILEATPKEKQTMLFSATFPAPLMEIARKYLKNPMTMGATKKAAAAKSIEQAFLHVHAEDRPEALERVLHAHPADVFLVFCESRLEVERLYKRCKRLPFPVFSLHGGYEQAVRRRVMDHFRTGKVRALIATDVAARGLDITHVTQVLNYSVPRTLETYFHRIGRTGRAGASGKALTFVTPRKKKIFEEFIRRGKLEIREADLSDFEDPRADSAGRSGKRTRRER